MKFAFLGYHQEQNWEAMSKNDQDAMIEDCFTYDRKLVKSGHILDDGTALRPSRSAKTLRWRNGAVVVADGPFAETKEVLGGVGVLEARDMAHAVELMAEHPGLRYGATFEVRPIDEESLQRQAATIAAQPGSAPTVHPHATRFVSLGYIDENGWESIPKSELEGMLARCGAFDEDRMKSGQWLKGIRLQSARTAKTLRGNGGRVIVTDGPYAETKECLGGVVVLAYLDLDDAVLSLSKHPALPFGVVIELRPIDEEIDKRWSSHGGFVAGAESAKPR